MQILQGKKWKTKKETGNNLNLLLYLHLKNISSLKTFAKDETRDKRSKNSWSSYFKTNQSSFLNIVSNLSPYWGLTEGGLIVIY